MSTYAASIAVRDRVIADGRTGCEIATLIAALPPRADRSEVESTAAFGLTLAYSARRRTEWADRTTRDLTAAQYALTDANGRYVDGGDGLASQDSSVIDDILTARYPDADDVWEAWELHPTFVSSENPDHGARFKAFQKAFWEQHAEERA